MKNFFELYYRYSRPTEPPVNFHAWSSIAALSALLGKKCFIPQGHFTVFPNLYIVLVGDPGSRKTTAMNIAKDQVKLMEAIPLAPESATREALIDDMAKNMVDASVDGKDVSYWQSAAFVSELEQFLGGRHINKNMIGFLTAIWDENDFSERTRRGGKVRIRNPYFSMLGCCTPSWMNEKLKGDIISDGFSRRTIFAFGHELNCMNPWPVTTEEQQEAIEQLQAECVRIFSLKGKFRFTNQARDFWDAKYPTLREEGKKYSEKVQHYFSSKHILAQKLAMCMSAAVRNDMIVDSGIIKMAYRFLEESEKDLDQIFSGVGRNELKAHADKVYKRISDNGKKGMTKQQLLLTSYDDLTGAELSEILDSLEQMGLVVIDVHVADSPPVYRSAKLVQRSREVNLLELASRITPMNEDVVEDRQSYVPIRLSDLEKPTSGVRLQVTASELGKGILLRGKRS